MKIWESRHEFNAPWETVVTAAQQKYPNPFNQSINSLDVVNRTCCGNVIQTQKIMATVCDFPDWAKKLFGTTVVYSNEHSVVDRNQRTMVLTSKNVNLNSIVSFEEKLTYKPDSNDLAKTVLIQESSVSFHNVFTTPLESIFQRASVGATAEGRKGLQWVIDHLQTR